MTNSNEYPKTDNCCTQLGWKEYELSNDEYGICLRVSVPNDTDLQGEFVAFCHDEQKMIDVEGWLFTIEELN